MRISTQLGSQIKLYYDIVCPTTWASLKVIKSDFTRLDIDYVPVSDFKIELKRATDLAELRKATGELLPSERPVGFIRNQLKEVPQGLRTQLTDNWQEIYARSIAEKYGAVLPTLFLISLKQHFPDFYAAGMEKLGQRLWEQQLPVHKGCYLTTCAREIGLTFRDSEFVISRLSHRLYRQILTQNSNEAVGLGALQSPFFVVGGEQPVTFSDVCRLEEFGRRNTAAG